MRKVFSFCTDLFSNLTFHTSVSHLSNRIPSITIQNVTYTEVEKPLAIVPQIISYESTKGVKAYPSSKDK